jgi:hypothetical protein
MGHTKYQDLQTSSRVYNLALFDRYSPALGLIVTSSIVFTLVGLQATNWKASAAFTSYVINQRTTVAIIVQVVSHVLGLIQIQALCECWQTS